LLAVRGGFALPSFNRLWYATSPISGKGWPGWLSLVSGAVD